MTSSGFAVRTGIALIVLQDGLALVFALSRVSFVVAGLARLEARHLRVLELSGTQALSALDRVAQFTSLQELGLIGMCS